MINARKNELAILISDFNKEALGFEVLAFSRANSKVTAVAFIAPLPFAEIGPLLHTRLILGSLGKMPIDRTTGPPAISSGLFFGM